MHMQTLDYVYPYDVLGTTYLYVPKACHSILNVKTLRYITGEVVVCLSLMKVSIALQIIGTARLFCIIDDIVKVLRKKLD